MFVLTDAPSHQGLNSTVTALSHWMEQEPLLTDSEYRPTQASDGHMTDRVTLETDLFDTVTLQRLPGLQRCGSVLKDERVRFCSLAPGPLIHRDYSQHDVILI